MIQESFKKLDFIFVAFRLNCIYKQLFYVHKQSLIIGHNITLERCRFPGVFLEAPGYVAGNGYPKLMSNLAYAYNKTGQYSEAMQSLASGITKEQRKLNGYLVNSMVGTLSAAYDHEEFRDKLELTEEGGNKNMAVRLRMARLLSDLRDYEKANDFIEGVIESYPDHELANELNEIIQNPEYGVVDDLKKRAGG